MEVVLISAFGAKRNLIKDCFRIHILTDIMFSLLKVEIVSLKDEKRRVLRKK
jgi:hypothetical protein